MRIGDAESVEASGDLPAHCRVAGVIETEIRFELLLPEPDDWNGRFLMGGGGGFVGSVQNQALTLYAHGGGPLQRGYATVGTDTGHTGDAASRRPGRSIIPSARRTSGTGRCISRPRPRSRSSGTTTIAGPTTPTSSAAVVAADRR